MAAALSAAHLDARVQARERARAFDGRLRWAIFAMTLLNGAVWGSMIAADRGVVDVHGLLDLAWSRGAAWLAALPHVTITISH
jgi:hypothetical protein